MGNIENRENLYGMNVPRGSFSLSGGQFSESLDLSNGKMPTDGPPMIIGDTSPGVFGSDWIKTYGASRDAYLTIVNGAFLQSSMDDITIGGIYREGSVNAINDNLWKPAVIPEGSVQQIQYMVSKTTIDEASAAVESYGEINEVRGVGLRIPSIAGGWGRTIDGRPTDPEPTDDNSKRKNDESHKVARETWKYGPVEYRWDYRKGVWSAYNELIADHEGEDLGTWVFSTNPDIDDGFPFLRGKLDDVWWVRRTFDLKDTDGTVEGVQTGEVMTHLEHKWFDETEDGAAKLSSIFIIPHRESASDDPDACHQKAEDTQELGTEITADCDRIDIKHDAHFFKEIDVDGPIKFGRKVSELDDDLCCFNPRAKLFVGEMIFLDEPLEICSNVGSAGGTSISAVDEGEPESCKWVPSVQIDECQLMGEHMVKLVTNDMKLAARITEICNELTQYTGDLAGTVDSNFDLVTDSLECFNRKLQELAQSASVALTAGQMATNKSMAEEFAKVWNGIQTLTDSIQTALAICGCEADITYERDMGNGVFISPPLGIGVLPCPVDTLPFVPYLECDMCYGVNILGPCTTQESFMAGKECGPYIPQDIDTDFGECMTHEDTA